ncbi:MAG: DUF2971 domain-containing protein [Pontiella sp.]
MPTLSPDKNQRDIAEPINGQPREDSENAEQTTSYYKYRSLYQGENEPNPFTKSIFEDNQLWYATPKDFNDPFDCNLNLHTNNSTDADWINYLKQVINNTSSIKKNLLNLFKGITKTLFKETQKELYEGSSVCCFSTKNNSIPMFSYYADSHRGIAIEFQFSATEVPCGFEYENQNKSGIGYEGKIAFKKIKYLPSFPELNYLKLRNNDDELINSLIFTKFNEWSHEDEFRIFRRKVQASNVTFKKELLTRVIFGCKTDKNDINLVKEWLKGWPSNVILEKAEIKPDQFELEITHLETI